MTTKPSWSYFQVCGDCKDIGEGYTKECELEENLPTWFRVILGVCNVIGMIILIMPYMIFNLFFCYTICGYYDWRNGR